MIVTVTDVVEKAPYQKRENVKPAETTNEEAKPAETPAAE